MRCQFRHLTWSSLSLFHSVITSNEVIMGRLDLRLPGDDNKTAPA